MNEQVISLDKFKIAKNVDNFDIEQFTYELRKLFLKHNVARIIGKDNDSLSELGFKDNGLFCMNSCKVVLTTFRKVNGGAMEFFHNLEEDKP